ncbi:MAG: hypothetical protein U0547_08995 [Dehalococcoidia bacterium]
MAARRTFESLDDAAVVAIAALFAVEAALEPYTPDGTPVYRITPTGAADGVAMVLWPSLRRVDVTSTGNHAWVLKNVGVVEVIEGVEAVFHPAEGTGFLFVSVNGWINMVMG